MLMPGPPGDVGTPTRPAGWPGAPPVQNTMVPPNGMTANRAASNGFAPPGAPNNAPVAGGNLAGGATAVTNGKWTEGERVLEFDDLDLDGARVIARVGTEVIQEIEVKAYINDIIEANGARIPPAQLEKVREKLTRDRLAHLVEIKLCLVDAKKQGSRGSLSEDSSKASARNSRKSEVKKQAQAIESADGGDLEAKMREHGSSLEREKQAFVEQQLAFGWIAQQTKMKHETTHEDLLAYYLQHIEDFSFPAKARWEELRVRTPNFPNRMAARRGAWPGNG